MRFFKIIFAGKKVNFQLNEHVVVIKFDFNYEFTFSPGQTELRCLQKGQHTNVMRHTIAHPGNV
jgi:hypothetical protein